MNKLQFTSFLLIILVFCGYRNKKQKNKTKNYFCNKKQTRWLKTTEIYSLTVLGARSPRVSLGNQGAGRMMFPLGKSDYCFFSFCAGSPRLVVLLQSLPLTSYCFLLVCVCVCVCVCVKERERERDRDCSLLLSLVRIHVMAVWVHQDNPGKDAFSK